MKKDEIAIFIFDPEKKDNITRYALEKMLKEIKSQLSKNKIISVVIAEADNA
jgi:hypothetical protein